MTTAPRHQAGYLRPNQHYVLGGWGDVLDDVRALQHVVAAVTAPVGSAGGASRVTPLTNRDSAERWLLQLRTASDWLMVDTWRFMPLLVEVLAANADGAANAEARQVVINLHTLVDQCEAAVREALWDSRELAAISTGLSSEVTRAQRLLDHFDRAL